MFGSDYPTPDGTGVRDYIHVDGPGRRAPGRAGLHRATAGVRRWNLGTGKGSSVLEVLAAFGKAAGVPRSPTS